MITDLRTVIWKEWRSLAYGQNRRQLVVMVVMLSFWAVWLPLQTGAGWMTDGVISLLVSVLLPGLVVAVTVPPAFAGERERKTLATLLATRLPDEAILFGKLVVPLVLGCLALVAVLTVSLVAANAASWDGSPRFYDPVVVVPNLLIGFCVALMVAALGVAISLRARRVQDAQQLVSLMLTLPAIGLGALAFGAIQLTGGVQQLAERIDGISGWIPALIAVGVLATVDAALLLVARRRFRRNRLIALT
jgi:ABC-2 type transport system permease protein